MGGSKDTDPQRHSETQGLSLRGCLLDLVYRETIFFRIRRQDSSELGS